MDLYRGTRTGRGEQGDRVDYSPKAGKAVSGTEERLDSGVDSLREEEEYQEYRQVEDGLGRLCVQADPDPERPAWKSEQTEDGDT